MDMVLEGELTWIKVEWLVLSLDTSVKTTQV